MKKIFYCNMYDLENNIVGYVWAEPFRKFFVISKRKWKKCCSKCSDFPRFLSNKPVFIKGIDITEKVYDQFVYEENDYIYYL